jgi:ribosomal protein S18 acetylase RimI-like enzyme
VSFQPDPNIRIISFEPAHCDACRQLYLEGKLADNDTGFDMDDIHAAYMRFPNHFWVALNPPGEVVGMIGVQQHDTGVGEIRRLRVRKDHQRRGIGTRLVETAVRHCRENNFLKITLDTFIDREPAIKLFEKFHFRHSETKELHGRALLYFYLDIYGTDRPAPPPKP